MKHLKENTRAIDLVRAIRKRIFSGNTEPIVGYPEAASIIGWQSGAKFGPAVGQVASRIDYACFEAGLPLLAVNYIRDSCGNVNKESFTGYWSEYKGEIDSLAKTHEWTETEFDKLEAWLTTMNNSCAKTLWIEAEKRGTKFIRYNLHRNVQKM